MTYGFVNIFIATMNIEILSRLYVTVAIYPSVITKLAYSQLEGLNHSFIVTPLNHPKYFLLLSATLCGVRVSVCSLPLCVVYG